MANKTIELNKSASSGTYIIGKIVCDATADNTLNNSDVTCRIYVRKDNDSLLLTVPTSGTWAYSMTINGNAFSGTVKKDVLLDWVLLATVSVSDIAHNDDGTKSISISGYVTPPSTSVVVGHKTSGSGTFTLDTVPRASAIASANDVTLSNMFNVKWTPASTSFRYRLNFTLGAWSYTTDAIHPNTKSLYTFSGYGFPVNAADQIPNGRTGIVTVNLYTYSDAAATRQVGSASSKTFTVTVPDDGTTKPDVSMTLVPVSSLPSAFDGLYIQGKSKVKAELSATGQYGATIESYSMKVDGISHGAGDGYTSDYLSDYGSKTVYAYATDSRDITGSTFRNITVIPYSNPKLLSVSGERSVIVARCDKDGNINESGTYLKIKAKRSFSPVVSGGVQKNFCKIQYRHKRDGGAYSEWVTILDADSSGDEVITGALLGGTLDATASYLVDVRAIDDIGSQAPTTFTIPTDKIYCHKNGPLNSFGFGAYVEEENTFLTGDDITLKARGKMETKSFMLLEQEITVGGDLNTYYPVHISPKTTANSQPYFLGVSKLLGTLSPAWDGNHEIGSSSLMIGWMFRCSAWDGNGYYVDTLYKTEKYAKLIAHVEGQGEASMGMVVWLRGGGASYKITCSVPASINVYLEDTDISIVTGYHEVVSPREYEGNYGIYFDGCAVRDVVVEQGTSGIWNYRKWNSGIAECWGKYTENSLNCGKNNSGGFYFSSAVIVELPPNLFSEDPVVVCDGGSHNYFNFVRYYNSNKAEVHYVVAGLIDTIADVHVRIHAKGRWK